jgi:cytochrome c biogenesis protein CcmG, thiol:disulfide interchange protein DsbE
MATRPSNLPYLVTAILALAVILLAWTGRDRFQPIVPGSPAPQFEVVTLDGEPVTLSDYEGRVVLLNVWATWCPPCIYEMPSMQRLYEELDHEDFEIVAVSVDGRLGQLGAMGRLGGDPRAFADSLGLTFPILWDPEAGIMRSYQATGVPESYVIGRDGMIYRRVTGATEWDHPEYVQFLRRLLAEEA